MNRSLIVYKIENSDVLFELCSSLIRTKLTEYEIHIIECKQIKLTIDVINDLWSGTFENKVLGELLTATLSNKTVEIWIVEGQNCINKIKKIKRMVRSEYAIDAIRNVLHSPSTAEEYDHNLNVLSSPHGKQHDFRMSAFAREVLKNLYDSNYYPPTCDKDDHFFLYMLNSDNYVISKTIYNMCICIEKLSAVDAYTILLKMGHKMDGGLVLSGNNIYNLQVVRHSMARLGIYSYILPKENVLPVYSQNGCVADLYGLHRKIDEWLFMYLKNEAKAMNIAHEIQCLRGYLTPPVFLNIKKNTTLLWSGKRNALS